MFRNYLKTAWRNIVKNKTFAVLNILGLTFGMTCSLLIFLWVKDELSVNRFHKDSDRLFFVYSNVHFDELASWLGMPYPLAPELKKDMPEVEAATKFFDGNFLLKVGDKTYRETIQYTNPDFFKVFSFPIIQGDPATLLTAPKTLVLTQKLARKYFGSVNPVGRTIRVVNLNEDYVVTGVMEDVPAISSIRFDALMPIDPWEKANPGTRNWGNFNVTTILKLTPQANVARFAGKIKHYIDTKDKDSKGAFDLMLQPFSDMYLYAKFENGQPTGGRIDEVRLFSIIAVFILLIACINFMNLTTARSAKRAKEVGVRKVVGATKSSLTGQFICEAILITVMAVTLAQLLVQLILPLFNGITSKQMSLDYADPSLLGGLLAITLITGFVSGSYPAFFLSKLEPVRILKGTLKFSPGSILLRKGLVVFQFALSVMLIAGTLIVYRQMQYIRHKNMGFDRDNVLYFAVDGDLSKNLDGFKNELTASSSIRDVTTSSHLPNDISSSSGDLSFPGKKTGETVQVGAFSVGTSFLHTLGIPLTGGRDFSGRNDSANYVVNELAVKAMRLKGDPIGQEITFWRGKGRIIGVVKDFHLQSVHVPITPLVVTYIPQNVNYILVKVEGARTAEALAHIRQVYQTYLPQYPFEYHFLDEAFERQYKSEVVVGQLTNYFALLGIFIACLGLFGLAIFSAEQRRKEIGVRKVLGASVTSLVALLSKDFLKLVLIAIVIASPIAWYAAHEWLANFAYRIAIEGWIFGLAGLLAVGIALLTISFQSIRAALMNPVKSLRTE